jgi:hypothetical protein
VRGAEVDAAGHFHSRHAVPIVSGVFLQ